MNIFGRHHVRSTFYHIVAIVFLIQTGLWLIDLLDDTVSLIITMVLFVADYIAEMYDPNPDNPGPWFKSHFHRFYDGDDGDDYEKCELVEVIKKQNQEAEEFFKKMKKRD